MTTLRRALPGLYRKESILVMAALLLVAMLFAGQPVLAMSGHSGGGGHGGGGGHSGGGGGHAGTAHPIGSGHFAGPARGFGGGHFVGGRFVGGRFGGGRFFGGGFFPVFGFGFGLGLGLAWDYPWWGPGWYGYPYWYGYNPAYGPYSYPPYYPGYPAYPSNDGYGPAPNASNAPRSQQDEMGALSLDLSPGDAEVYLDGQYIGRVRDFSGWRSGYLWLKKGTYDIVFYKDGYKTLARQVSIYPGLVIKWDDKMEHGQAVRPEDLPSKSHDRRDSRLQFEQDRAEQIDRQQQSYDQGQQGGWNTWQDRVNQDRGGAAPYPAPPPPSPNAVPQNDSLQRPAPAPSLAAATADQYGRLRLKVEPEDASVYLDGRFVGTGSDLAGNEAGLVLAPGHHRLSVVRPGHRAEERSIDAVLGKDVDLTVTLAPTGPTS